jgi:hypothetical protein
MGVESLKKSLLESIHRKKPKGRKMTTEENMMRFPITRKAWLQAGMIFSGIAIPCDKTTADGGTIRSEKVLKFNRKAMRQLNKPTLEKVDPRMIGSDDRMRFKVGKPGSKERVDALALQYASLVDDEMSPFEGD